MNSDVVDDGQVKEDVLGLFPATNNAARESAAEVEELKAGNENTPVSAITLDDILGVRQAVEMYTFGDGNTANEIDTADNINKIQRTTSISENSANASNNSSFQFLKKAAEALGASTKIYYSDPQTRDSPRDLLMRLVQIATARIAELDVKTDGLVDLRPAQDRILENTAIKEAVDKFMALKGRIEYQTERGGAAIKVMDWMKLRFIDPGYLTPTEVRLIPLATYKDFDHRLYQALINAKRAEPR